MLANNSRSSRRFPYTRRSSAEVMAGDGLFAKYAFFDLTRKNPIFEHSVIMYVSIKNRVLTQFRPKKSGLRKSTRRAHPPRRQTLTLFMPFLAARMAKHIPAARWILFSGKKGNATRGRVSSTQDSKHARHGGDFCFLARKNGFLCRECTLMVLDRNKKPF